jgi:hypothetical protein
VRALQDDGTFTDAKVQKRVAGFVPLKIDVDRQPEIARRYSIEGMPTTVRATLAEARNKLLEIRTSRSCARFP